MPATLSQLHPLDEFYANAGIPLPRIQFVPGEQVPEPFNQLLVHEGDMTPTLEEFYKSEIHLQVLKSEKRQDFYYREVVLRTEQDRAVEFGAIKIFLGLFPPAARRDILEERFPLGHILAYHKIPHLSRPKAYLKLRVDQFIGKSLGLAPGTQVYGRRNTLSTPETHPLAEIVEILPPA